MNKTIIISGFPGIGKSYFAKNSSADLKILDLESSDYHYRRDPFGIGGPVKLEDGEWIGRYADAICEAKEFGDPEAGYYDYILISSHREIRDELRARGVDFIVVIPEGRLRNEYMRRFLSRGSSMEFMKKLYEKWPEWICDILDHETLPIISIGKDEYLSDVFNAFTWLPNNVPTYCV